MLWGNGPAAASEDTLPGGTIAPPGTTVYLPLVSQPLVTPPLAYVSVPVEGPPTDRSAATSPDLNLTVRGWVDAAAYLGLVNYNGDSDENAPQLDSLFQPARLPVFASTHQVYDWNWECNQPDGCRGELISKYGVTLLGMATVPGEPISIPRRNPQIYAGGFKAMVLYADEERLTLVYTRNDTPARGYLIHLEDLIVNPGLVDLFRQLDAAGRGHLPALRNGEIIGVARGSVLKVATRDTGEFLDPRACKDWWVDYRAQCTVQLRRPD